MSFKIGFTAETERKEQTYQNTTMQKEFKANAKKSVVDVYFPDRHLTCSYYNDMFDLKRGDIVYVDGKLEGLRGRVTNVNYTFKIKLSDYKRVIGVADTDVIGEFHLAGSHFITTDGGALPFEQIITWFKAPYFMENRVAYIELDHGKGRAIVTGTKPYEVEFNFANGDISGLVCNCYCTGACKHEFAVMLQLKETLDLPGEITVATLQRDSNIFTLSKHYFSLVFTRVLSASPFFGVIFLHTILLISLAFAIFTFIYQIIRNTLIFFVQSNFGCQKNDAIAIYKKVFPKIKRIYNKFMFGCLWPFFIKLFKSFNNFRFYFDFFS